MITISMMNNMFSSSETHWKGHPTIEHTHRPLAILDKVPNGPDSSPNQNRRFMEALCPFPKLPTDSGELDEICLGYAC